MVSLYLTNRELISKKERKMKTMEAVQVIAQKVELVLRELPEDHSYDYALISPLGETVGWLRLMPHTGTLYTVNMIDNSFRLFDAFVEVK
jgi:hypothetical protein